MHTMRSRYIWTAGALLMLMVAFGTSSATRTASAALTVPTGCTDPTDGTYTGVVVLDPGHGGSDSGAVATNGLLEKHVVLDIAGRARDILVNNGYRVCLTRTSDVSLTNTQRAQYANDVHGDVFVLIHLNGSTNKNANYTSTFWGKKSKDLKLSEHMLGTLRDLTGPEGGRDFVGQFASGALLKSNMEATLTESAFLTNDAEAALLADPTGNRRQQIAQALANGISSWSGSRTGQ